MKHQRSLSVFLLATMLAMASAYDGGYLGRFFNKRWQIMRRSTCADAAGKCFTSAECCEGLVCAAIDDYFGTQPEAPGYCVKEKELQTCGSQNDCSPGSLCLTLGRTGERYCVPSAGPQSHYRHQAQSPVVQGPEITAVEEIGSAASKGLGEECSVSSDCKPLSGFSSSKLCCQDVRRGRQGVRRICDRVTSISVCI